MKDSQRLIVVFLLLLLSGCSMARAPKRAYQFAYCKKMNADGRHCDFWATPCGRLECK